MAERRPAGRVPAEPSGKAGGRARQAPQGTDRLKEELEHYIEARVERMLEGVGHRLGEGARRLSEAQLSPRGLATAVAKGGKKVRGSVPPGAGALTTTAARAARDGAAHAKDAVLEKAKAAVTGKGHEEAQQKSPGVTGKGLTIIEDIDVGVPVREAYDQWTQFQEFDRFAKGVVGVQQEDDTTTRWHVRIAKANRQWRGTITEQVPDERIAWTSEGDKATTQGVVTFHPLGENLTKVLLVLRYFPAGPVERAGALVRAQGRRARLDLKRFRAFVMMRGEATGGWRGEIREGEVVRGPEEEPYEEERDEEPEERYDEGDELEDEDDEDYASGEEDDWDEEEEAEEGEEEENEDREPDDRYDDRPSAP